MCTHWQCDELRAGLSGAVNGGARVPEVGLLVLADIELDARELEATRVHGASTYGMGGGGRCAVSGRGGGVATRRGAADAATKHLRAHLNYERRHHALPLNLCAWRSGHTPPRAAHTSPQIYQQCNGNPNAELIDRLASTLQWEAGRVRRWFVAQRQQRVSRTSPSLLPSSGGGCACSVCVCVTLTQFAPL